MDTISFDQLQSMGATPLASSSGSAGSSATVSFDDLEKDGAQPLGSNPPPISAAAPAQPSALGSALKLASGKALDATTGLPISDAISALPAYGKGVYDAAKPGVNKTTSEYKAALDAKDPLSLVEHSVGATAGAIETAGASLAPLFKPVGAAVNFVGDKLSDIPTVQKFANSKAGEVTSRVAEDVGNLSTIAGAVVGGVKGGPAVKSAIEDAATTPASTFKSNAIEFTNKALGNTGKKTASTLLSNDSKRLTGLETFYRMTKDQPVKSSDGTTFQFDPTNIKDPHEMLQAFVQAKQGIWDQVQTALEKGSSVKPDYAPVKADLQKVIDSPGSTAQAKAHASARLNEVTGLERGGVGDAQTYLQQLNSRLGATFSGASDAIPNQIDAKVANGVNGALDKGLETIKDANVRPLKDMYASLKSIEPDLVKTVQKLIRKTGNGVPQYINDFGNLNLLEAAFAHNPLLYVAKGAGMKVLSKVLSGERDPLVNLSKAFKNVAGYMGDAKAPETPPTLALPPGTRGAPSSVSSGAPINLPSQGSTNARTTVGRPLLPPKK